MAEFPALPLWTDAYLGDTMHLDATEHGAYLLLLIAAWRTDATSLPDDDKTLARYARCTTKVWSRIRPIMAAFFEVRDGRWTQLRLREEKHIVQRRRDAQASNGKASALKRKERHATKRPTTGQPSDQPQVNQQAAPISSSTLPNGKGADAPPNVDPVKVMFDAGVALLKSTGSSEKQARQMVARWQRDRGDAWTREAIASAAGKTNPISWIEARAKTGAASDEDAAEVRRATLARYRNMDMPGPPPGVLEKLNG